MCSVAGKRREKHNREHSENTFRRAKGSSGQGAGPRDDKLAAVRADGQRRVERRCEPIRIVITARQDQIRREGDAIPEIPFSARMARGRAGGRYCAKCEEREDLC